MIFQNEIATSSRHGGTPRNDSKVSALLRLSLRAKRSNLLFWTLLSAISIVLIGLQTIALAQTLPSYTAGVMAKSYDEKRAKALEKFDEIIGKYIEERAGIKIRLKALTYPDLARAIEKGSVDIIWGYGLVVSMELSQKFPIVPIVAPTLGEERRTLFKRFVISTKDSVQSIADLKGKRLTYLGDEPWSFELLLFKVWVAEKMGVKDIRQVFDLKGRQPDEGFFIPASKRGGIYSLIIKEADLAVAHEFEYITQEKLTPHAVRERIEILPFFNPPEGFMEAPVFVRRGLDKKDIEKLVKVVMEMPNDPEGKQILISSKISSFVKVTDQDYQPVKTLITKKEGLGIK
jgi:ABC-type phosphate/phosphonate transport system substrate-binding protein